MRNVNQEMDMFDCLKIPKGQPPPQTTLLDPRFGTPLFPLTSFFFFSLLAMFDKVYILYKVF